MSGRGVGKGIVEKGKFCIRTGKVFEEGTKKERTSFATHWAAQLPHARNTMPRPRPAEKPPLFAKLAPP